MSSVEEKHLNGLLQQQNPIVTHASFEYFFPTWSNNYMVKFHKFKKKDIVLYQKLKWASYSY